MRSSRLRGESGASLVEFALVLPVFFTVMLGMFTGGLAYNRKLSVTQATREGARYGATLPLTAEPTVDEWLRRVANVTVASSESELRSDRSGVVVCVSYVASSGSPRRYQKVGTAEAWSNQTCFDDGRAGETRVQIVGRRTSKLEALVWSDDLVLSSQAVSRYEAG